MRLSNLVMPVALLSNRVPGNEISFREAHVRVVEQRLYLTWGGQWQDDAGNNDRIFGGMRCPTDRERNIDCLAEQCGWDDCGWTERVVVDWVEAQ